MSDTSETMAGHSDERGVSKRTMEWAVAFILFALAALVI